jgi:hypothetical protein
MTTQTNTINQTKGNHMNTNVTTVWKTIKLGTGLRTADDFREAVAKTGRKLGTRAYEVLSHPSFRTSNAEVEVDLVKVTPMELGLPQTGLYGVPLREETDRRAIMQGLQLCPTEVAPQLRIQGDDEDYCMVVTEKLPFKTDDGEGYAQLGLGVMGSDEGQKPTLAAYAEDWTLPNLDWVYVRPRK